MEDESFKTSRKEKRLKILAADEIESIYGRPCFTDEEQTEYFALSQSELELLEGFRTIKSQVYLILQLGYFRAKHLFFIFTLDEVESDFEYIIEKHFNSRQMGEVKVIDKQTQLKQQRFILELYGYRSCAKKERQELEQKAQQSAMVYSKPIYVFREIINYLTKHKIVIPGYSLMQDIVSLALTSEQNRLINIIYNGLKTSETEALKKLLSDSTGLYEITQLKHEPRDFSLKEIKQEIHRGEQLFSFYQIARKLLPEMGISNENIKYYASLVGYYSVARLKRLNEWTAYIYIICFAYYRYQQRSDNLINCLISRVRHYSDEAKSVAKERLYECFVEINENLQKAGQVLKLLTDESIAPDTPFQAIQSNVFGILPRQKLMAVADQMAKTVSFDETTFQWEYIDKLSRQFKLHLRQVIMRVEFTTTLSQDTLIEAVDFLKAAFNRGKPLKEFKSELFPVECIPASVTSYLYAYDSEQQKQLIPDRYEFLIYRLLRNGLESGDISCRDSIHFRSLEDDLIDDLRWQEKQKLMVDNNLTILTCPIEEHLILLEQTLEERIVEVNRRISAGENEHFQIKKRGNKVHWNLLYPQGIDLINSPFFDDLKQVNIGELLHFVDRHCNFIKAFDHVLGRYQKHPVDDRVIIACLIAWGNNMGMGRMGQISDINYQLLASTSDNFIRLETLKEANDLISNAISQLSIFHHYDIDNMVHSSSDGQKFEARIRDFQEINYSIKIKSPHLNNNDNHFKGGGVSYHQLRRAISHANFGKLRFKSELEQQLWGECGRLIANCILYYNASILSNVLAHRENINDVRGIEELKQISPVAWQHINLYGRYEFRKFSNPINLDDIVQQLTQAPSH